MMVKMIQLKKDGRSSAELIRDETKRMRNSIDMFLDTNLKAAREYAYQEADIKIDKEDGIKGWLSLAVLDNRTSHLNHHCSCTVFYVPCSSVKVFNYRQPSR
jgi:hypothetical protein